MQIYKKVKVLFNFDRTPADLFFYGTFFDLRGQIVFMQKLLLLAGLGLIVLTSAFKPLNGLDDVIKALRNGNAQELARYIDDNIEISLPNKSESYSRSQAVMVLKDFFNTNKVKGFEVQFKGENSGNQYCVGKLLTGSGTYRTTVFMKSKDGKQLVKEIRFQSN